MAKLAILKEDNVFAETRHMGYYLTTANLSDEQKC